MLPNNNAPTTYKLVKPTHCIHESHMVCNPEACAVAKCIVFQKHRKMTNEQCYELGLRERPKDI